MLQTKIELRPAGWVVLDKKTGKRLSDTNFTSKAAAQECCDRKEHSVGRARAVKRPCITCGTAFDSEGAHNRMCDRCRTKPDTEYGFATGRRVIHV